MVSYKHALIELLNLAKISGRTPEFHKKINATFGQGCRSGPLGIYMGDNLVLPRTDYQTFLDGVTKTETQVVTNDSKPVITPPVQALQPVWDYREIDGVWCCRHCDKTLKTEKGISAHIERAHPEKLEDAE